MTRDERLNNAVKILNFANNWSDEHGYVNMYDYIIPENSYQIRIKGGMIFKGELNQMQYLYIEIDNSSEYNLVIQF